MEVIIMQQDEWDWFVEQLEAAQRRLEELQRLVKLMKENEDWE